MSDESVKSEITIECSYSQRKLDKNIYPLFVRFKPNNIVVIKLDESKIKNNIGNFIKVLHKLFEGLKILKISYPDNYKSKNQLEYLNSLNVESNYDS